MIKATRIKTNILWILPILAVIFAIVLLGVALAPTSVALAEGEPVQITLGEKTVHRGQTFAMDIDVTANSGLTTMKVYVDYDHDAMTLIDVKRGSGLSSMNMTLYNVDTQAGYGAKDFAILFDATKPTTDTGVIARLVFESNIEAPMGDYEVTMTYKPEEGNTNSEYMTPVALGIKNGWVHLIAGEYTAKYLDWDDAVLYEKDYNDGDAPAYPKDKAEPFRKADDCYTYAFNTWKGEISDDPNVLLYRAVYTATPKSYNIFYYVDGLTDDPNDVFDDADFYKADSHDYGSQVILPNPPKRPNYTFVGWFADDKYMQPISGISMPSHDTRVYAYMRYNVRVADIPKIRLTYTEIGENEIQVDATMAYNPGINGMVLTLDYDRSSLNFVRFTRGEALSTMQFDTTNLAGGLNQDPFRFYWESGGSNSTETGLLLSMVFNIGSTDKGVYPVTFTYNESTDVTYQTGVGEIWYSRLDIVGTKLPVGELTYWEGKVGDTQITVTSDDGKPVDVKLDVKNADVQISEASMTQLQDENLEIKNMYSIQLLQNGQPVESENNLRITLGLTEEEIKSRNLKLYYIDGDGNLVEYEFSVEDNAAVFTMRNIKYWAVVGDAPVIVNNAWTPGAIRTVLVPSLLAVTVLAYAILLLAKNGNLKNQNKKKNLDGKGGND